MRVVSLVPSATETLRALGVTPVGCTRFCDAPGIAIVGGTKRVDIDAIVALRPDLVVVNDEENRIEDADALRDRGLSLHSMSPRSVADVGSAVVALGAAVDASVPSPFDEWDAWCDDSRIETRARAFVPIWRRPYMSLAHDTYGSSLLAHVGIANVLAGADERYPDVDLGVVAKTEPDLVLLPSEPYEFSERHVPELQAEFTTARIVLVDGRDLFWWGSRTPAAHARLRTSV
jgi:ABC-type Fe3+-hydroxamate transport system substrate-binding protein